MQWLAGAKHHQLRRFAAGTYDMSLRLVVLQVVFLTYPLVHLDATTRKPNDDRLQESIGRSQEPCDD